MEMIKETRIKIALTAFTLDQYINILAIKSSELESLIDFKNWMIDFFGEFDFVECLCFIKLFHSKQFDLQ